MWRSDVSVIGIKNVIFGHTWKSYKQIHYLSQYPSIKLANEAIDLGQIRPEQLVREALDNIKSKNSKLNALITVCEEKVSTQT